MLRMNIFRIVVVFIVLTASGILLHTGCYQDDDDARVTINLNRSDLALLNKPASNKRVVDRILEFFSTPAYAVSGWDSTHGPLILKVSGPSIDTSVFSIPQSSVSYTVTVSAVNNVTFEIYSTTTLNAVPKNWGGRVTLSLLPGDQDITITMIPMTKISTISGFGLMSINWEPVSAGISNASSYVIYRSDSINGDFVKITEIFNIATTNYTDPAVVIGKPYYYRISVDGINGEGLLCDPVVGTRVY